MSHRSRSGLVETYTLRMPRGVDLRTDEQRREATECAWTVDEFDGSWDTSCANKFMLESGTPTENKMRFCCYCGKPLASKT